LSEVERMLKADPNSNRKAFTWEKKVDCGDYLSGSVGAGIAQAIWVMEWPLIKKVGWQTFIAFLVVSGWGSWRTLLGLGEARAAAGGTGQQGQLAERGLARRFWRMRFASTGSAAISVALARRQRAARSRDEYGGYHRSGAGADQQLLSDYLAHEKAQAMRVLPVELTSRRTICRC